MAATPSASKGQTRLTTRGRCLASAGLVLVVGGLLVGGRDLLRAGVLLLALVTVALLLLGRTRYRLSCERTASPAHCEIGGLLQVRLRLRNVSRLTTGVLLLADRVPRALGVGPRFALDRVPAGGSREVTYPLPAGQRGRFAIGPLTVQTRDAFGLCELTRSFQGTDPVLVVPRVVALPHTRLGSGWDGGADSLPRSLRAGGSDDIAVREYRHGDDLRKVHWRSTARTGELMVRRDEQPAHAHATLVLDNRHVAHRGSGPSSSWEAAVSAVASIGAALLGNGYTIGVVDLSGGRVTGANHPVDRALLLEQLAELELVRRGGTAVSGLRAQLAGATVAVLGELSADEAQLLAALRATTGSCVAVCLDVDSWLQDGSATGGGAPAAVRLLRGAGWRAEPWRRGSGFAQVWARLGSGQPLPAARS